ncbi:MAG: hypothetical protein ACFB9M_12000 [Myxococcota bacterium]
MTWLRVVAEPETTASLNERARSVLQLSEYVRLHRTPPATESLPIHHGNEATSQESGGDPLTSPDVAFDADLFDLSSDLNRQGSEGRRFRFTDPTSSAQTTLESAFEMPELSTRAMVDASTRAAGASEGVISETRLSQAAQRLVAEAREKALQSRESRLPLNLNLEESAIPMRLRFTPRADGRHDVAFVVASYRDHLELKKRLPEIQRVLTELPLDLTDVQIEVRTPVDRPHTRRKGSR